MSRSLPAIVLGLDGGGTQTRALAAAQDGRVLGEGLGGSCNIAAVPVEAALGAALTAMSAALMQAGATVRDVQAICAGVAGTSYAARREAFQAGLQAQFAQARVSVVPDFAVALTGATEGTAGVIVIAGTGSVAYGENAAGQVHRTGGYGYLIDDAGSGYGVGRAALAAVLHAADGTGDATTLTERVLTSLNLSAALDIVPGIYGGTLDRVAIAALSRAVADAAGSDSDPVAGAILMRAGGALAQLTRGVTSTLFPPDSLPFSVTRIGGLWNAGTLLTDVFTRSVARFAPQAVMTEPRHAPVYGAALRAAHLLQG